MNENPVYCTCGAVLCKGMQFDGIVDMSVARMRFEVKCCGCKRFVNVCLMPTTTVSVNGELTGGQHANIRQW